jgi:hypothetical protein
MTPERTQEVFAWVRSVFTGAHHPSGGTGMWPCWHRNAHDEPEMLAVTAADGRRRQPKHPTLSVSLDGNTVRARHPDGTVQKIAWSDLGSVTVMTASAGSEDFDLTWVLARRDGRSAPISVPMGAEGEHELQLAMQARLSGFDNMTVIEAMSATECASFLVWDHAQRNQDE